MGDTWTGKTACFLGDSITEGIGVSHPENRYVERVKIALGLAAVRNYGLCASRIARQAGDGGASFCDRYAAMEAADLFVVFGGCNDFFHGTALLGVPEDRTKETFYGACHTLLRGMRERWLDRTIAVFTPLHSVEEEQGAVNAVTGAPMSRYVEILREVAGYYALPVLDLYHTSGIQPAVPAIRERYCPDGTHPNDEGHALLTRRMIPFLCAL